MNAYWTHVLKTPVLKLVLILFLGIAITVVAVQVALQQYTAPAELATGDQITSGERTHIIEELDLISEPGEIENHNLLWRFYERQQEIIQHYRRGSFTLKRGESVESVSARPREISDLPLLFWLQIFVGLSSLFISGVVWALRSKDIATGLFAISGLSIFISSFPSAIYTTRSSPIPLPTFRILEELNAIGASGFGVSMIALFLLYPVRLRNWKSWSIVLSVLLIVWTILFVLKWTPSWLGISPIILVEMIAIAILIFVQLWATKGNPKARASLTWLGLSVLIGAGAFVGSNTVPAILGTTPLHQGYAFLFFLVIYLGLAAGITRFRLFEVGQWAFTFFFYTAGVLLFVLLDAALIFFVGIDRSPALGIALLTTGFLYLPLRDALWRFFSRQKQIQSEELLADTLHVAFAPSDSVRSARWEALLKKIFQPLQMEAQETSPDNVHIESDGLVLIVPSVARIPALKLSYPWSGRSLYSPQSKALAEQVVSLVNQAESSRQAYDRGVVEERLRMAQDLHDDLGAKLLTGIHTSDDKTRPAFEAAMDEMKSIVREMSGEKIPLSRLMADSRHEISRRLMVANIALDWPAFSDSNERCDCTLDYRLQKAVKSAFRETVSNVLRHSGASTLKIRVHNDNKKLNILIQDNGCGFSEDVLQGSSGGFGLTSLRKRILKLGGTIGFETQGGCSITISIPIEILE